MARIIKEYNKIPNNIRKDVALLNNLSGAEWTQLSKSVNTYGGPIAKKRKIHGAAFPVDLVKHFIKIYTNEGDIVLDPFMGVGTTADACTILNRNCIGFELNIEYYQYAVGGIESVDLKRAENIYDINIQIHNDSCINLQDYVLDESVSLTITSPPYCDLLHKMAEHFAGYTYEKNIYRESSRKLTTPYSDNHNDFGNMTWEEYQQEISRLMSKLYDATRPGGFNVWVVRDYRDIQNHIPYVNLHSKIVELASANNWVLFDIIIWDQSEQRKLVKLGGAKSRRFYFNIGHSYILIFRKNIQGEKFINVK